MHLVLKVLIIIFWINQFSISDPIYHHPKVHFSTLSRHFNWIRSYQNWWVNGKAFSTTPAISVCICIKFVCKTLLKFYGLTTWIQLNTPLPWKIITCLNNSFVDPNQSYSISDEYIKLNCFLQYSFAFVTHWRFSIKNCSGIQRCNHPKPELLIRDCCNLFQFIITTDRMRIQKGYIPIDFGDSTVTFLVLFLPSVWI